MLVLHSHISAARDIRTSAAHDRRRNVTLGPDRPSSRRVVHERPVPALGQAADGGEDEGAAMAKRSLIGSARVPTGLDGVVFAIVGGA
jgi:hypothetical protein